MEDFTITGPLTDVNPYMERMIKFWKETKKNLYSFLLTLDVQDLLDMSDVLLTQLQEEDSCESSTTTKMNKWEEIGYSLAIIGYSMEMGKDTGEFTTSLEDIYSATRAFAVMIGLALEEKLGKIKVTDESYFFDPKVSLKIELLK